MFFIPTPSQSGISHTLTLAIGDWSKVTSLANHMTLTRFFPSFFQLVIGERKQHRRDQCLYFLKRKSLYSALEKNNTNDERKREQQTRREKRRRRRWEEREGRREEKGESVSERVSSKVVSGTHLSIVSFPLV